MCPHTNGEGSRKESSHLGPTRSDSGYATPSPSMASTASEESSATSSRASTPEDDATGIGRRRPSTRLRVPVVRARSDLSFERSHALVHHGRMRSSSYAPRQTLGDIRAHLRNAPGHVAIVIPRRGDHLLLYQGPLPTVDIPLLHPLYYLLMGIAGLQSELKPQSLNTRHLLKGAYIIGHFKLEDSAIIGLVKNLQLFIESVGPRVQDGGFIYEETGHSTPRVMPYMQGHSGWEAILLNSYKEYLRKTAEYLNSEQLHILRRELTFRVLHEQPLNTDPRRQLRNIDDVNAVLRHVISSPMYWGRGIMHMNPGATLGALPPLLSVSSQSALSNVHLQPLVKAWFTNLNALMTAMTFNHQIRLSGAAAKFSETTDRKAVGAMLVAKDGRIIAFATNMSADDETCLRGTRHAETMLCYLLQQMLPKGRISEEMKAAIWAYIREATLYTTLESCNMCAGNIVRLGVKTTVYKVSDLHISNSPLSRAAAGSATQEKSPSSDNVEGVRKQLKEVFRQAKITLVGEQVFYDNKPLTIVAGSRWQVAFEKLFADKKHPNTVALKKLVAYGLVALGKLQLKDDLMKAVAAVDVACDLSRPSEGQARDMLPIIKDLIMIASNCSAIRFAHYMQVEHMAYISTFSQSLAKLIHYCETESRLSTEEKIILSKSLFESMGLEYTDKEPLSQASAKALLEILQHCIEKEQYVFDSLMKGPRDVESERAEISERSSEKVRAAVVRARECYTPTLETETFGSVMSRAHDKAVAHLSHACNENVDKRRKHIQLFCTACPRTAFPKKMQMAKERWLQQIGDMSVREGLVHLAKNLYPMVHNYLLALQKGAPADHDLEIMIIYMQYLLQRLLVQHCVQDENDLGTLNEILKGSASVTALPVLVLKIIEQKKLLSPEQSDGPASPVSSSSGADVTIFFDFEGRQAKTGEPVSPPALLSSDASCCALSELRKERRPGNPSAVDSRAVLRDVRKNLFPV